MSYEPYYDDGQITLCCTMVQDSRLIVSSVFTSWRFIGMGRRVSRVASPCGC